MIYTYLYKYKLCHFIICNKYITTKQYYVHPKNYIMIGKAISTQYTSIVQFTINQVQYIVPITSLLRPSTTTSQYKQQQTYNNIMERAIQIQLSSRHNPKLVAVTCIAIDCTNRGSRDPTLLCLKYRVPPKYSYV